MPIVLPNFQFFIQSNNVLFSILSLPLMVQPWVVGYSFCLFRLEESHFFFVVTPTFRWILDAYSSNGPQCAFAWWSPCSIPCHASLAEGFPKQCIHIQRLCPAMLNVDDMVGVFKFLHCTVSFFIPSAQTQYSLMIPAQRHLLWWEQTADFSMPFMLTCHILL